MDAHTKHEHEHALVLHEHEHEHRIEPWHRTSAEEGELLENLILDDQRRGGDSYYHGYTADQIMFLNDYIAQQQIDLLAIAEGTRSGEDVHREKKLVESRLDAAIKLREIKHQSLSPKYALPLNHFREYRDEYERIGKGHGSTEEKNRQMLLMLDHSERRSAEELEAADRFADRMEELGDMGACYEAEAKVRNLTALNEILTAKYNRYRDRVNASVLPYGHDTGEKAVELDENGFDDEETGEDREVSDALHVIEGVLKQHNHELRILNRDRLKPADDEYV
jgi:hypothetical protein